MCGCGPRTLCSFHSLAPGSAKAWSGIPTVDAPHLHLYPAPTPPSQLSRPDSLFLTWPKGSRWLFVSFSFWKETSCRIQWAPVAGESGWT